MLSLPYYVNIAPDVPPAARTEFQIELRDYGQSALRLGKAGASGFLDLVPVSARNGKQRPVNELLFDKVHPTRLLNEQYARAIATALTPWVQSKLEVVTQAK